MARTATANIQISIWPALPSDGVTLQAGNAQIEMRAGSAPLTMEDLARIPALRAYGPPHAYRILTISSAAACLYRPMYPAEIQAFLSRVLTLDSLFSGRAWLAVSESIPTSATHRAFYDGLAQCCERRPRVLPSQILLDIMGRDFINKCTGAGLELNVTIPIHDSSRDIIMYHKERIAKTISSVHEQVGPAPDISHLLTAIRRDQDHRPGSAVHAILVIARGDAVHAPDTVPAHATPVLEAIQRRIARPVQTPSMSGRAAGEDDR